ncbi:MAG: 2-amino-4-hydroxy-6-hydroxymethyldihydropteridine diphosphokinase, partial [Bacteroidales bacterium]|nr:2-amino-4-hydroxy-6-hydroxymethyldihydropteridine diphosphokinase [Bacteroidales bacterium]
ARRPQTLLRICKRIEREMGRRDAPEYDAEGRRIYHDRPIDIDILLYGDERVDTPDLQIPHPLMQQREFVMRPLREIFEQK